MNRPHVQFVLSDAPQPSSRWLGYAAAGLSRMGPAAPISASSCTFAELPRFTGVSDILVIEHNLPLALARGARGQRLFLWLDDALWCVPGARQHARQLAELWQGIVRHSRQLAGVITPSATLARALRERLPWLGVAGVHHIPNYHDFSHVPDVTRGTNQGWGGSLYHVPSWRDTRRDWLSVVRARAVEVVGHPQVAAMLREAGAFVTEFPMLDFADYMERMASWAVALIPVHGEYDGYRSWIKALEACWCGTPWFGMGDQVENVYYGVPGRIQDLQYSGRVESRKLRKWAEAQRIDQHTDEWLQCLLG